MGLTVVLFGGALAALLMRWELGFWVLAALSVLWQFVSLERRR